MHLLLDTHIFLWLTAGDPRLNPRALRMIAEADKVFLSSASIWEISIKVGQGKLDADPDQLLHEMEENGFEELPVYGRHAKGVAVLPRHHGDPFDRLLIAQAIADTLRLLTADSQLVPYSELVECVRPGPGAGEGAMR